MPAASGAAARVRSAPCAKTDSSILGPVVHACPSQDCSVDVSDVCCCKVCYVASFEYSSVMY